MSKPRPRHVLLSGHGVDADAFNRARRASRYNTLAILSSTPDAPELVELRRHEALANVEVEVHAVDAGDFSRALASADAILRTHEHDDVRVHVAGGSNLVTSALLLAAFRGGKEAFYCHARGVSRLPVAQEVDLVERFTDTDRAVLLAIGRDVPTAITAIVEGADLGPTTVKSSLIRLRRQGLVEANHESASLTATGAYYRAHLAPSLT